MAYAPACRGVGDMLWHAGLCARAPDAFAVASPGLKLFLLIVVADSANKPSRRRVDISMLLPVRCNLRCVHVPALPGWRIRGKLTCLQSYNFSTCVTPPQYVLYSDC